MRKDLRLTGNIVEILIAMSEENIGAVEVLKKVLDETGFMGIYKLDQMNIRGSQIWTAYKDYCNENFELFMKSLKNNDPDLVKCVNIETVKNGRHLDENIKAITLQEQFNTLQKTGKEIARKDFVFTPEEIEELKTMSKPIHPELREK